MSSPAIATCTPVRLTLPATSANLGPGFDAVGLALSLALSITASASDRFSIAAEGRDVEAVGAIDGNLILATYTDLLRQNGRPVTPLALSVQNAIPLGMGLGSSAAALCAGVMLANHFGALGWSLPEITHQAALREGHPDNVAACMHGGLTVSRSHQDGTAVASFGQHLPWRLLLALPTASLATHVARGLLPESYSRADVVKTLQAVSMLVSAFALGAPELLRSAAGDRVHEPYRRGACPLFAALGPLAAAPDVFSVTLSGAGPSTLLIVSDRFDARQVHAAGGSLVHDVLDLRIGPGASFGPAFHSSGSQSAVTRHKVT